MEPRKEDSIGFQNTNLKILANVFRKKFKFKKNKKIKIDQSSQIKCTKLHASVSSQ